MKITMGTVRAFTYIVAGVSTFYMCSAFGSMVLWGHAVFHEPNVWIASTELCLVTLALSTLCLLAVNDFYPAYFRVEPKKHKVSNATIDRLPVWLRP